ncbi:MAG: hypothetical protein ACYC0T_15080 [Ramlibacter sp.]
MRAATYVVPGAGSPAGVHAYAGRTLDLLRAIERTIDHISENRGHVAVLAGGAVKYLEQLQARPVDAVLDPDGAVCAMFAEALGALERIYRDATVRRAAAASDRRLRGDDGVVEVYDDYLSSLSGCHDVLHEVKEWIETHDALLEPAKGGTYADAGDLIDAIQSDRK